MSRSRLDRLFPGQCCLTEIEVVTTGDELFFGRFRRGNGVESCIVRADRSDVDAGTIFLFEADRVDEYEKWCKWFNQRRLWPIYLAATQYDFVRDGIAIRPCFVTQGEAWNYDNDHKPLEVSEIIGNATGVELISAKYAISDFDESDDSVFAYKRPSYGVDYYWGDRRRPCVCCGSRLRKRCRDVESRVIDACIYRLLWGRYQVPRSKGRSQRSDFRDAYATYVYSAARRFRGAKVCHKCHKQGNVREFVFTSMCAEVQHRANELRRQYLEKERVKQCKKLLAKAKRSLRTNREALPSLAREFEQVRILQR